jgi:ABC-type multidrug transport system fused ATPase/permease subunit
MIDIIKKLSYLLPKGDGIKLTVLFIMMLVAALLEVAGIGMIPAFVAIVAAPDRVMELEVLFPVFQYLGIENATDLLIWGSVLLVVIFIVKSLYMIAFAYLEARYLYNRRYIISHRLMNAYMHAPYTFHLERNTAELLRNATGEINVISNIIISNILTMAKHTVMAVSIFTLLLVVEPLITLIVFVLSIVGAGGFLLFTQKKMKRFGEEEQERRMQMIKAVYQGLGGIKEARVLNREQEFVDRYKKESFASTRLMAYIKFIQQIPKPMVETTAIIGMLLISALLVWQGRPMSAIIPILTLFGMATVRLMPSVQMLSSLYANLRYNLVSLDPIYNDQVLLADANIKLNRDRRKKEQLKLENEIEIEDLTYQYPNSDEMAVDGVSFKIKKGEAIALIGESGAGKTTMVDLLLGLLEPTRGGIYVDDKNVQEHLSGWQKNIGYIPQSIYLADESLRRNIAFGLPEDQIDDELIHNAVKLAQLGKLVKTLPDGLDTIVGEHGTRLSGGQRQRVGIARALYHNPQILIMDEATSALDNITEKHIIEAIEKLKGERTIVMIAHRLTTVMNCDQLYLMSEGKIIKNGTYTELMEKSVEFREMALES